MGAVAMRGSSCCCLGMLLLLAGWPAGAISVGQVDTFQTGTSLGWGGGSAPTNVATGGPAGTGDRYLRISATANNLGTDNSTQWSGDYLGAGVTSLRFDVQNQGPDPVALRITVFGPNLFTAFTSVDELVLAAGSGWVTAEFALTEAALERKRGTDSLAQTLAAVSRLLIRHDADPLSAPGEPNLVSATVGIDNITAVPEPGTGALVCAGLVALAVRRLLERAGAVRGAIPSWVLRAVSTRVIHANQAPIGKAHADPPAQTPGRLQDARGVEAPVLRGH
jgi:hypothetical protein